MRENCLAYAKGRYSQTGLGGLIGTFTAFKLLAGFFPKKSLKRHLIQVKKVASFDFNLEETVKVGGLSIAGAATLFLAGNYGVSGDFNTDGEEWYFATVMLIGIAALTKTAAWQFFVLHGEMKCNENTSEVSPCSQDGRLLTGLSSVWIGLGVAVTSICSGGTIARATKVANIGHMFGFASLSMPPIGILYIVCLFAKPRQCDRRTISFLCAHYLVRDR